MNFFRDKEILKLNTKQIENESNDMIMQASQEED